ncbi:hypothetical protein JCM11491_004703 [Sporobolomyces phaffii]
MSATGPTIPLRAVHRLRQIKSHLGSSRSPALARSPVGARQFSASHPRTDSDPAPEPSSSSFTFTTACSFRGKPGCPVYVRPGPGGTTPAPAATRSDDRLATRLKQGLSSDHPLAIWRDAQLEKSPNGAGHDWFFVEGVPAAATPTPTTAPSPAAEKEPATKVVARGIKGVVLGVADGVGGWEESGVDPSHFSQALMWFARERVRTGEVDPARGGKDLKLLLERAFDDVTNEKAILAGSSTACIVALDSATGKLHAANLGDSSFMVLRPSLPPPSPSPPPPAPTTESAGNDDATTTAATAPTYSVVHSEPSQTHFFNAPYQLSKLPPSASSRGESLMDLASDAATTPRGGIQLHPGDVVLVTTDGFGDNVFGQEVEQLCTLVHAKCLEEQQEPPPPSPSPSPSEQGTRRERGDQVDDHLFASSLAQTSLNFARLVSFKRDKVTPFEVEARRYGYGKASGLGGGKVDDITVVVAVVGGGPGRGTEH